MSDEMELRSERGMQMLAHATSKEYCVIEFSENEDGSMTIADITDHVRELERLVDDG